VFLEAIMARALKSNKQGITIGGTLISNLRFVDDIASLAEGDSALQEVVTSIATESGKMGMRVNEDKTEVQYIGKQDKKIAVQVYGKTLSQVSDFVYLGGVISNNDMSDQDIKRRIGIAYGAMQKLKKIWEFKDISAWIKVKVYEALSIECCTVQFGDMDINK